MTPGKGTVEEPILLDSDSDGEDNKPNRLNPFLFDHNESQLYLTYQQQTNRKRLQKASEAPLPKPNTAATSAASSKKTTAPAKKPKLSNKPNPNISKETWVELVSTDDLSSDDEQPLPKRPKLSVYSTLESQFYNTLVVYCTPIEDKLAILTKIQTVVYKEVAALEGQYLLRGPSYKGLLSLLHTFVV